MCGAITHRGPDDEGTFVEGEIAFGMRRLSIIDLAGGHQPIFSEDGRKVIVFNGEIYNYRELRAGLVARGHSFRTDSDTECILHLYEELGERCVERLRGMFGIAIWDRDAHVLFLARDRFGIKPLYVAVKPEGVAFASELKALIAGGVTDRALDWEALDAFFQLGYIPSPMTPFTDVRKLEPGTTLTWRAGGATEVRRYWELPMHDEPAPADVERQVREWLDESVSAHMVADVPVAAFLSGGIDSSAIVASMATHHEAPHTFTARFLGSGAAAADETPLARLLAARYGARLTVVDVNPDVARLVEPIVRALDEPHADESAIPSWILSEAVAREYKVVLAGTGGDELFAGYRRHLGLLAGDHYARVPSGVRRGVSALAQALPEPRSATLGVDRLKRFLRSDGSTAERYLGYMSRADAPLRRALYASPLARDLRQDVARTHFESLLAGADTLRGVRRALYLDYRTYLPDEILALSDRISMAHSLEVRVPFADHLLVERVFPLPDRIKLGSWRPKRLLRASQRDRIPSEHFAAPKRGFVGPTAAWMRHELREMMRDELAPDRLRRLGLVDPDVVAGLLDDHLGRRQNRAGILWALLCFLTWHRLYVEDVPAPSVRTPMPIAV